MSIALLLLEPSLLRTVLILANLPEFLFLVESRGGINLVEVLLAGFRPEFSEFDPGGESMLLLENSCLNPALDNVEPEFCIFDDLLYFLTVEGGVLKTHPELILLPALVYFYLLDLLHCVAMVLD